MGRRGRATASAGVLSAAALVGAGLVVTPTAGTTSEGRDGRIAWSRDGDVFTMRPDGTGKRRLTENPRYETARWSPDGRRLAVVQWPASEGQRSRLVVMDPNGDNARVVARTRLSVQLPSWSPDGRRIAFCDLDVSSPDEAAPYKSAISVVDVAAGTRTRLTEFADGACGPTWSPSGDRIAYTAWDSTGVDVYVMRSDGSQPRALRDPSSPLAVAWSPTGETLAVISVVEHPGGGESTRLETVLADGTGGTVLAESREAVLDHRPVWSPDGERVLFSRLTLDPYGVRLGVVGADGAGLRLVTRIQDVGDAAWSPTSGRVVVARDGDLFRLRPDGSAQTRLTVGKAHDAAPDWQAR